MLFRALSALTLLAAFATPVAAQGVTGVPGFNDYTVGGSTPGSTSCQLLFIPGGGFTTFTINTAPGVPVVFLFTAGFNCRCVPCYFPLPVAPCPVPLTSCSSASNQSIDLFLGSGCPLFSASAVSDSSGNASITVPLPASFQISSQAGALHPCATGFPVLFTQSYSILT